MSELLKQNDGIDVSFPKDLATPGQIALNNVPLDDGRDKTEEWEGKLLPKGAKPEKPEKEKKSKTEKAKNSQEEVKDRPLWAQLTALAGIFHDRAKLAETPGQLFDVAIDYDANWKALATLRSTSVLLENKNTIPFTETDGFSPENMEKFLAYAEKSMKKQENMSLWWNFFGDTIVAQAFASIGSFKNITDSLKQQGEKPKETWNHNIETNEIPVDTVKMIDMLMRLLNLPDNEQSLMEYADNLPSLKAVLWSNKTEFKKNINDIKQWISKDNPKKDALEKSYDALLWKYDILVDLLWKIDTMVYGEWTEALMAKAWEKGMTPEKLIADKKSLLDLHGIMHMKDSTEFDKLIAEFGKPGKKEQVITIVKAYLLKTNPDLLKKVSTISVWEEEIVQEWGAIVKRPAFKLYDEAGNELEGAVAFGVTVKKKGNDGKEYFDYPAATMDDVFHSASVPSWAKELFKFEKVNTSNSKEPWNEASQNRDGNLPMWPLDAISLLLNSKAVRELKIFLLSAFGSSNNEWTEVQINFLTSLNDVEDYRKTLTLDQKKVYGYTKTAKDGGVSWLMGKMNNIPFATESGRWVKKDQTTADFPWSQKNFYTEILSPKEKVEYALNIPSWTREKLQNSKNEAGVLFADFYKKKWNAEFIKPPIITPTPDVQKSPEWTVLQDGKAIIRELMMNAQFEWKVEEVSDAQNPYLVIDGQVVTMQEKNGIVTWSFYVENDKWVLVEKDITISKVKDAQGKDTGRSITVTDWSSFDLTTADKALSEGIFKDGKVVYSNDLTKDDNRAFDLFSYYTIAQWIDGTNPIDPLYVQMKGMKDTAVQKELQKAIAIMGRELKALAPWDRIESKIKPLIKNATESMTKAIATLTEKTTPKKSEIEKSINDRSVALGIT